MPCDHSMVKRREYRIPLALPVTFSRPDMERPFKGRIKNISSYGALAKVAGPLPKGTLLNLFFRVPATGERVDSIGMVKWCKRTTACYVGIEFRNEVFFKLPLCEVARLYSQGKPKHFADHSDKHWQLLGRSVEEFQHLTYWGALFWFFSEPIHALFSRLVGQVGLSSFRFERFYRQVEHFSADQKLKARIKKSLSALGPLSGKFNDIATLFGVLKKRQYVELAKTECHVDLNHIIEDNVTSLQEITMKLTNGACKIEYLLRKDLPLIYGQRADFAKGIDFLLLYLYQSVLHGNCTGIIVQSTVKDQTIQVDFFNDGSKIFEKDYLIIDYMRSDFTDQLTARDVKNILGLYYSLLPLKKYNAYIVIQSESGNNNVSLRIPV